MSILLNILFVTRLLIKFVANLSKLSFSSFTNALAVLISVSTLLSTIFFPIKLLFTLSNALTANLKVVLFDTLAIVLPTPVSANLEAHLLLVFLILLSHRMFMLLLFLQLVYLLQYFLHFSFVYGHVVSHPLLHILHLLQLD